MYLNLHLLCLLLWLSFKFSFSIYVPGEQETTPRPYTTGLTVKTSQYKGISGPLYHTNYSKVYVHNKNYTSSLLDNSDTSATYKHEMHPVYISEETRNKIKNVLEEYNTNIVEKDTLNDKLVYKRKVEKTKNIAVFNKCPKGLTGQFVYDLSCNQYLDCWNGRGGPRNCAPGTLFNPKTLECDFPDKVECITGPTGTSLILQRSAKIQNVEQAKCPEDFVGLMPNYTDCTKFLDCNNGYQTSKDCPPGTLFDCNLNMCNFATEVTCFSGRDSRHYDSYTQKEEYGGSRDVHGVKSGVQYGGQQGTQNVYATAQETPSCDPTNPSCSSGGYVVSGHNVYNLNSYQLGQNNLGSGNYGYAQPCDPGNPNCAEQTRRVYIQYVLCNPLQEDCGTFQQGTYMLGPKGALCDPVTQQCGQGNYHIPSSKMAQENVGRESSPEMGTYFVKYVMCQEDCYRYPQEVVEAAYGVPGTLIGAYPVQEPGPLVSGGHGKSGQPCNPQYQQCNPTPSGSAVFVAENQPPCNPQYQQCSPGTTIQTQYNPSASASTVTWYQYGIGTQGTPCNPQYQQCSPGTTPKTPAKPSSSGSTTFWFQSGTGSQAAPCNPQYQQCPETNPQTPGSGTWSQSGSGTPATGPHIQWQSSHNISDNCNPLYQDCTQGQTKPGVSSYDDIYGNGGSRAGKQGFASGSSTNYHKICPAGDENCYQNIHGQSSDVKCPEGLQGITSHPTDCAKFLNCANGITAVQECGPDTLFNPQSKVCDHPENVDCTKKVSVVQESATCPDGFTGITQHPTDCSKFLNCANGQTFIQDCGPGTLFNPISSVCDHPYNVDCNDGKHQTTTESHQYGGGQGYGHGSSQGGSTGRGHSSYGHSGAPGQYGGQSSHGQGQYGGQGSTGQGSYGQSGCQGSQCVPVGQTGYQGQSKGQAQYGGQVSYGQTGCQGPHCIPVQIGYQGQPEGHGSYGQTGCQGSQCTPGQTGFQGPGTFPKGNYGPTTPGGAGYPGQPKGQGSYGQSSCQGPHCTPGQAGYQGQGQFTGGQSSYGQTGCQGSQCAPGQAGYQGQGQFTAGQSTYGQTGCQGPHCNPGGTWQQGQPKGQGSHGQSSCQGPHCTPGQAGYQGQGQFTGGQSHSGQTGCQGSQCTSGQPGYQGQAQYGGKTDCQGQPCTPSTSGCQGQQCAPGQSGYQGQGQYGIHTYQGQGYATSSSQSQAGRYPGPSSSCQGYNCDQGPEPIDDEDESSVTTTTKPYVYPPRTRNYGVKGYSTPKTPSRNDDTSHIMTIPTVHPHLTSYKQVQPINKSDRVTTSGFNDQKSPDYVDIFDPSENRGFAYATTTQRAPQKQVWPPAFPDLKSSDSEVDYIFEYENGEPVTLAPQNHLVVEKKKKTKCDEFDFMCDKRSCVERSFVCDGVKDCKDGKDEVYCLTYIDQFKKYKEQRLDVLEKEKWTNVSIATCAFLCMNNPNFECQSFNYRRMDKACFLTDKNVGRSGALKEFYPCDYYERKALSMDCSDMHVCPNGKCLTSDQICDGYDDCGDRQDEKGCKAEDFGYSVQLAAGEAPHEGRIEVTVFGKTGYICDDQFSLTDAEVLCKELGFKLGALEVKGNSHFAKDLVENNTKYMMDDIICLGNETSIMQCDFAGWGIHNCEDREIAGVVCKTPQAACREGDWTCDNGIECVKVPFVCDDIFDCSDNSDEAAYHCDLPTDLRLVNGTDSNNGRLEIRHHGIWGSICDDDFNEDAAKIACNALGFNGRASVKKDAYYGQSSGPIWLDQVSCKGNETSLEKCTHWDWGESNCDHSEDVGIDCSESVIEVEPKRNSKNSGEWSNYQSQTTDSNFSPEPVSCGYRKDNIFLQMDDVHFRVVQGSVAKPGDYPWQAALRIKGQEKSAHWCGAVVISAQWVLTAAHCLEGYPKGAYVVVAGEYNIDENEGTEQQAFIEEYYLHENFREGHKMGNDIAMVRLKGDGFKLNQDIQPICLPDVDADYERDLNCTISGFGTVQSGKSAYSHKLRASWIPVQRMDICKMAHIYGENIAEGMICAGDLTGGVDACDGDSGGPLACLQDGVFTLYGITSWGQRCGYANKPGVYVKVAYYRNWIENIMKIHS